MDNDNITDWFSSANLSESVDHQGLSITKEDLNSVSVTFKSGKDELSNVVRSFTHVSPLCL